MCEENCYLYLTVDPLESANLQNVSFLKIKDHEIVPNQITISEIELDQETKSNYQVITYEVTRLDGLLNTYQDVTVFSNKEKLFQKIKNLILK